MPQPDRNPIPTLVNQAFEHYDLPGLAVGVIEDGRVVAVETRGELAAGGGEPVTAGALFKIASNTKAMTGAVLARPPRWWGPRPPR